MNFSKDVVLFDVDGIPVIGHFGNGSLIGLTPEGAAFCQSIREHGVAEGEIPAAQQELFSALQSGGFFAPSDEKTAQPTLASAYVHLTQRCNLHCVGCYSKDCHRNRLADPSLEQVKRALDQLARNGCRQLVFSGGEPFLRADLGEIVRYAAEELHFPGIQIITNGTCVTEEMLAQIRPYVSGVAVSIDGYSEECPTFIRDKGIFGSVVHAIEMCRDAGIHTSLLPTVHTKNYDRMAEYVKLSQRLNVEISFSLLTCSPMDKALSHWLPTPEQLSHIALSLIEIGVGQGVSVNDMPIGGGLDTRKSCEAGHKIISVDADGTVYPCHMLHDPDLKMGNVFTTDLAEILDGDLARHCRSLHVDNFDGCKDCKHRYLCGGGCRARSYYVHKNLTSHDFYCPMTMTYFDWVSENLRQTYG